MVGVDEFLFKGLFGLFSGAKLCWFRFRELLTSKYLKSLIREFGGLKDKKRWQETSEKKTPWLKARILLGFCWTASSLIWVQVFLSSLFQDPFTQSMRSEKDPMNNSGWLIRARLAFFSQSGEYRIAYGPKNQFVTVLVTRLATNLVNRIKNSFFHQHLHLYLSQLIWFL